MRIAIAGYVRLGGEQNSATSVVVKLETREGAFVDRAWTGSSGRFEFSHLRHGTYTLVVEEQGYKPFRQTIEYYTAPIEGILITLVPETKDGPAEPGAAVSVRELNIPRKAREEFMKGQEAVSQRKADDGAAHFRKAIGFYRNYDEAYVQLGLIHLEQHSFAEAQKVAAQAIEVNSKNARAHALLGSACRQQNLLPQAEQELRESLKLDEGFWFTHLELARTLMRLRRNEESFTHAVRAHQLNPQSPSVHILLYDTLVVKNDYKAAVAELDEFLKLFPDSSLVPRVRQQREALVKAQGEPPH